MAIEILRRRPPSDLLPSKAALDLIRHFEGLRLVGYADVIGKATVGYGHTGDDVAVGKQITLAEADALLEADMAKHAQIVRDSVTVPLTQGEWDALCSLAFNLGYIPRSMRACLNGGTTDKGKVMAPGSYGSALLEFPRNCRAGGKPLKGLYRRRLAEACVFNDLPWENACSISVVRLELDADGNIDPTGTTSLEDTILRARMDTSKPPDPTPILQKPWSELVLDKPLPAEPAPSVTPAKAGQPEEAPARPPADPAPISKPAAPVSPSVAVGPASSPKQLPPSPAATPVPAPVVKTAPPPEPDPKVIIAPKSVDVRSIPYGEIDIEKGAKNMTDSQRAMGMVIVGVGSVIQVITTRLGVGTAIGAIAFDLSRDPVVIALAATAVAVLIGWLTKKRGTKIMTDGMKNATQVLK